MPDDELLDVAAAGKLTEPRSLTRQVARMLADPRADALVDNFASQWLFLRDVEGRDPDPFLFRDYDEGLRAAFATETELFVASVFRSERSVLDLVTANYTFLNERLAEHYGIPHVRGSQFRRVEVPADSRARRIARAGQHPDGDFLLHAHLARTSRQVRIRQSARLTAASTAAGRAGVVAETVAAGQTHSMREALAAHRADPQCASCHAQMDPIGFALEQFDAVGRWRKPKAGCRSRPRARCPTAPWSRGSTA